MKEIRKYICTLTVLSIIVGIASISLFSIISIQETRVNDIVSQIETSWRSDVQNYLGSTQIKMDNDIRNSKLNPYDDDDIRQWFTDNMGTMKITNENIENFTVLSIGSTIYDKSITIGVALDALNINDPVLKNTLNEKVAYLLSTIKKDDGISNRDINTMIDTISDSVACEEITKDQVVSILHDALFDKDKVLFSINEVDSDSMCSELSYSYKNKNSDNIWVESVLIPEGKLGFDNELRYIDGKENKNYKKLVVCLYLNSDTYLSRYNAYINGYHDILNISLCLLTIITLSSILIIYILFKKVLYLNMIGGVNCGIKANRDTYDHHDV